MFLGWRGPAVNTELPMNELARDLDLERSRDVSFVKGTAAGHINPDPCIWTLRSGRLEHLSECQRLWGDTGPDFNSSREGK